MKSETTRFLKTYLPKSNESSITEDPTDWVILRLNSKINNLELRYLNILSRITTFTSILSKNIDKVLQPFSFADQDKLVNEILFFSNQPNSINTFSLFSDFKNELIDKLYSKDFNIQGYKAVIISLIDSLCHRLGVKESLHVRRASQGLDDELSTERLLTPLKSSRKPSSPCDRAVVSCPGSEIKVKDFEGEKRRGLVKVWKEELGENLGFGSVERFRGDSETLMVQNACLKSELENLANSVHVFLNKTSKFQREFREKEGFESLNLYEVEKKKLEIKIRENIEKDEGKIMNTNRTDKESVKGEMYRVESRKKIHHSENFNLKLIDDISKQYLDKLDSANNAIVKLETDNRSLKNKLCVATKELKKIKNLGESKVAERLTKSFLHELKGNLLKNIKIFAFSVVNMFEGIEKKVKEKDEQVCWLKKNMMKVLKGNLKELIDLNEKAEKGNEGKEYKIQIENLKYLMEQSQRVGDGRIKALEIALAALENEKNHLESLLNSVECENLSFKSENLQVKELEKIVQSQKEEIWYLENLKDEQRDLIKNFQKEILVLHQVKFERDCLEKDNAKLKTEILKKDQEILMFHKDFKGFEDESCAIIEKLEHEIKQLTDKLHKLSEEKKKNSTRLKFAEEKASMTDNLTETDFKGHDWSYSVTENSPFIDELTISNENLIDNFENYKQLSIVSFDQIDKLATCAEIFQGIKEDLQFSFENSIIVPGYKKTEEQVRIEIEIQFSEEELLKLRQDLLGVKKALLFEQLEKESFKAELKKTKENYKTLINLLPRERLSTGSPSCIN